MNPRCPKCRSTSLKLKDQFLPVIMVNTEAESDKKECIRFLFCSNCGEIIQALPQDVSTFWHLLFDIKKQLEYFHFNFSESVEAKTDENTD